MCLITVNCDIPDYNYIYKNLGMTYMAPDLETITHIQEVAENFKLKYHLIDNIR